MMALNNLKLGILCVCATGMLKRTREWQHWKCIKDHKKYMKVRKESQLESKGAKLT